MYSITLEGGCLPMLWKIPKFHNYFFLNPFLCKIISFIHPFILFFGGRPHYSHFNYMLLASIEIIIVNWTIKSQKIP